MEIEWIRRYKHHSGAVIALVALVIYGLFPSREFYWDGIGFAAVIESARSLADLFNPNHLVYNLLGWLFWKVLTLSGLSVRALFVLQAMNALFAAASVFLLWKICESLTGSARLSDCCAILFAFSSTWWRFAADANAYIAATFFLLMSFKLLLRRPSPNPYLVGLAHGAAMIVHELALLFLPVAIAGLMLSSNGHPDRRCRSARIVGYVLTIVAVVGFAYSFGFFATHPGGGWIDLWQWVTIHSQDSSFSFNFLRNLRMTLRGTVRLFLGGRFSWLQWDIVTFVAALVFCACAAVLARTRPRPNVDFASATSKQPILCYKSKSCLFLIILWCASFGIFLFFWLPQNTFYRLLYLPGLVLLMAFARDWCSRRIRLLLLAALTLCLCNFVFLIYPLSKVKTNEILTFALQQRSGWTSGSRIVFGVYHTDLWTISYFTTQAKWEYLPVAATADPESFRREAVIQGQHLWLDGTAYDRIAATPDGRTWLNRNIDPGKSLLRVDDAHQIRFYKIK